MKTYYLKLSTSQWAWGASAHWRLYYSLKTFGKKCSTYINAANEIAKREQRPRSRNSSRYRHTSRSDHLNYFDSDDDGALLADSEVNEIICKNETAVNLSDNLSQENYVEKCEINQLGSNEPNEDQVFVTKSKCDSGLLFGVLDGHGGATFGEYVKNRLPYYLHVSLATECLVSAQSVNLVENLVNQHNLPRGNEYWIKNLEEYMKECSTSEKSQYSKLSESVLSYVKNPLRQLLGPNVISGAAIEEKEGVFTFDDAIKEAFTRLDIDIMKEVFMLSSKNQLDRQNAGLINSGSCALIAYLLGKELFIANLGDCRAVLGSSRDGLWSAVQLTHDHTAASNSAEVQRILSEHPTEESRSCLAYGRLLGRLAPLRALGDFQFKMTNEELTELFQFMPKYTPFSTSLTPPYLTAEPEVFHYRLDTNDRFIVLASDGLWDMLGNDDVVQLVGSYIEGRQADVLKDQAYLYNVPNSGDSNGIDSAIFDESLNENVASFLIRQALGGYDHGNLKYMLSLKHPDVRLYRDDISILVIFLKNDDPGTSVTGSTSKNETIESNTVDV